MSDILCGAIRPLDNVKTCNRDAGHDWEHMNLNPDGTANATWDAHGRESCDRCGHRLNERGLCIAPLSVAD